MGKFIPVEVTCVVCGKKTMDNSGRGDKLYCSRKCFDIAHKRDYSMPCKHREGVSCTVPDCMNCGWHPEVEARRIEAIRKGLTGA